MMQEARAGNAVEEHSKNRKPRLLVRTLGRRIQAVDCSRDRPECGGGLRLLGEVIVVPEIAIERAGQLGGARTERRPSALEEKDRHQAAHRGVRVRGKPAEASAQVRAGSGLAKDRELGKAGPEAAGGTV